MKIPDSYRLKQSDIYAGKEIFKRYWLTNEPTTEDEETMMDLVSGAEQLMRERNTKRLPTAGDVRAWHHLDFYKTARATKRLYCKRSGQICEPDRLEPAYRERLEAEQAEALR